MRELWANGDRIHPYFTLHGVPHLSNVQLRIGELLSCSRVTRRLPDVLTGQELFFLLAACWLHDVGMILPVQTAEKEIAREQGLTEAEFVRSTHHSRSKQYILEHASTLGLEVDEAPIIATIAEAHRKVPLSQLPASLPNLRFMSACLRVADELDISRSRAPGALLKVLWKEMDSEAQWHWCKAWAVADLRSYTYRSDNNLHVLAYQCTIALPDAIFLEPLWNDIVRPIRNVLKEDMAEMILAAHGVGVDPTLFQVSPIIMGQDNDVFPMRDVLRKVYGELGALPKGISDVLHTLHQHSPTLHRAMRREVEHLMWLLSRGTAWSEDLRSEMEVFLGSLCTAASSSEISAVHSLFVTKSEELFKRVPDLLCCFGKGA